MNSCILIGRLTRNPSFSTGTNENGEYSVAGFYLAVPRKTSKECSYIKITSFGKTAEFVKNYLTKGKKIAVRGELVTGSYKDQKTDQTVYTTEIFAQEIEFADKKESNGKDSQPQIPPPCPDEYGFTHVPDADLGDLPFK